MAASLNTLAEFFHGVATQLEAGLAIQEILAAQAAALGSGRFGDAIRMWRDRVEKGGTWSDGLQASGAYLPPGTAAVIAAGERTGRLPACCKLLADDFEQRIKLSRTLMATAWYPLLVLTVALFVAGLMLFLNPAGKFQAQMQRKPGQQAVVAAQSEAAGKLFLWIVAGAAATAIGGAVTWRLLAPHQWYGLLPLNPRLTWRQSSLQFFRTWHMAAAGGLLPDQCMQLAGDSIQHPGYRRQIHAIAAQVREQRIPPSQLLGPSRFVDVVELQQIVTMEKTGNVEETLGRLAAAAGDRFARGLKLWMGLMIGLLVAAVIGFVIWQIISFFLAYVGMWDMKNYR